MRAALTPIRIVTRLRTSADPEVGLLIEDRILRPLTAAERKAGKKDELAEWYRTFGCVRPVRRRHRRQPGRPRVERTDPIPNDPPKELQEEIYAEMKNHFHFVALDLARAKIISLSDLKDVEHDLFRAVIDELPKWNPERASRRTFLYEATATTKADVIRALNARKRKADFTRLSIVNVPVTEVDGADEPDTMRPGTVSAETIPERAPSSVEKLELRLALIDFVAMLDPDEVLTLDYLLQGFEGTEVAQMMSRKYTTWRKSILESLQLKAICCGFEPHHW